MQHVQIRLTVDAHTFATTFEQLPNGRIITTSARSPLSAQTLDAGTVLTVAYETATHWGVIINDSIKTLYLIAKDVCEVYQEAKGIWQRFKVWWNSTFKKKVVVPTYPVGKLPVNTLEKH